MSKKIAIIVNKSCDICTHCEVPEFEENLKCKFTKLEVEDDHTCGKFELCKEVINDTFFRIQEIKDYEI